MRERSRARGWALQGLYAWEIRGAQPDEAIGTLHQLFTELRVSSDARVFAEVLVRLVSRNLARIDTALRSAVSNWRLERLSAIDRNVLRLGTAELMFVDDVPPHITIREMMRLAGKYGTPESPRFVNGVLDAVVRQLAPQEVGEAP